jgi:hypothetical protein
MEQKQPRRTLKGNQYGKPRKAREQVKTYIVQTYMTEADARAVAERSQAAGITVSGWVRQALQKALEE